MDHQGTIYELDRGTIGRKTEARKPLPELVTIGKKGFQE